MHPVRRALTSRSLDPDVTAWLRRRPTAGRYDSCDEATGERLDNLEDPFLVYRRPYCSKACPKGLNPAKDVMLKKAMVDRQL